MLLFFTESDYGYSTFEFFKWAQRYRFARVTIDFSLSDGKIDYLCRINSAKTLFATINNVFQQCVF